MRQVTDAIELSALAAKMEKYAAYKMLSEFAEMTWKDKVSILKIEWEGDYDDEGGTTWSILDITAMTRSKAGKLVKAEWKPVVCWGGTDKWEGDKDTLLSEFENWCNLSFFERESEINLENAPGMPKVYVETSIPEQRNLQVDHD